MTRASYIGEGGKHQWVEETATKVQDEFNAHGHGFILIPWMDLDEIPDDLDHIAVGTCITDCTDPFMFAVAMAGAISSFALTSKTGNKDGKAGEMLAQSILDIVKDVNRVSKNGKKER